MGLYVMSSRAEPVVKRPSNKRARFDDLISVGESEANDSDDTQKNKEVEKRLRMFHLQKRKLGERGKVYGIL